MYRGRYLLDTGASQAALLHFIIHDIGIFQDPRETFMALRQSTGGRASIIAAGDVFGQIVLIRSFVVTRRGTSFGVAQSITTEDVVLVDSLPLIVLLRHISMASPVI